MWCELTVLGLKFTITALAKFLWCGLIVLGLRCVVEYLNSACRMISFRHRLKIKMSLIRCCRSFVQTNSLCNSFCCHLICRQEIRSATSSMTSVPKPLKFLRPHYGTLKSYFETMPESELKVCVKCWSPSCAVSCDLDWFDTVLISSYCFPEIHGGHFVGVSFDNVPWRRKGMCLLYSPPLW